MIDKIAYEVKNVDMKIVLKIKQHLLNINSRLFNNILEYGKKKFYKYPYAN